MRHFYGFVGLPNHWADDNDFIVGDRFFEDKEYVDYYFDNFFEMDKIFGHEKSAFGTRGLPVGHPNRTSKSFDRYNALYGPAIVRVIKKDDLTENIYRLKELMGVLKEEEDKQSEEEKDCYPSDYKPGKKYGRDELSKMFSCFAGESNFPVEAVKEMMFPLLPPNDDNPKHHFIDLDPKKIQVGPDEFVTMKERADKYKKKFSKIKLETISLTPDQIHPDTIKFIPKKESVKGGKERIEVQMKRALKDGVETLTDDEPFVVEMVDGMYRWDEGWNRLIALMKLYEQGKISKIKGKSWVAHPA